MLRPGVRKRWSRDARPAGSSNESPAAARIGQRTDVSGAVSRIGCVKT
jgi:hypothetical protein